MTPLRSQYPDLLLVHYMDMDDILFSHSNSTVLWEAYAKLTCELTNNGLHIAPDKVQTSPPYSYLGYQLHIKRLFLRKFLLRPIL